MKNKTQILLVDNQYWVRAALVPTLDVAGDMQVAAEAEDLGGAIRLFGDLEPDVVVMEMRLPNTTGADAIRAICRHFPWVRVLALSNFAEDEDIYQALAAGALGCVAKGGSTNELVEAIRAVAAGKKYLPLDFTARLAKRPKH
jgi:DNA-binding NarL/FixJ family response regulator